MSINSTTPFAAEINTMRQSFDTSNPVIAEILRAKEERLKILQELNRQHEEEFGDTDFFLKIDVKKEKKRTKVQKHRNSEPAPLESLRRSARLQNSPFCIKDSELPRPESKSPIVRPPNDYGAVPGIEVGTQWETRMECSQYGVHRPTVAGIHAGPQGAYSIALSGGYPEDIDEGDSFIYTGAGGRDLKGTLTRPKNLRIAPQTKDQQLEGTNLSLVKSIESKLPVRVIRGYKSPSIYAPETGYRYDGLYQVVEYWEDIGKTGYKIYRFKMQRMKDEPPAPWEADFVPPYGRSASAYENLQSEISFNDESEFKENIPPPINYSTPAHTADSDDMQDIDREIEKCIKHLCKTSNIKINEDLQTDCDEEEFHGWD